MLTPFVLACVAWVQMQTVQYSWQEPIPVCQAIEKTAVEYELDPTLMAAIAYHESRFGPRVISRDGYDFGSMQVRVRTLTGNPWVRGFMNASGCTPDYVLTVEGGVVCGAIAMRYAQYAYEEWLVPSGRAGAGSHWLGCYACCQSCPVTTGVREFWYMQKTFQGLLDRQIALRRTEAAVHASVTLGGLYPTCSILPGCGGLLATLRPTPD